MCFFVYLVKAVFLRNVGVPNIIHHSASLKSDFTSFNIVYTLAFFNALVVFLKSGRQ